MSVLCLYKGIDTIVSVRGQDCPVFALSDSSFEQGLFAGKKKRWQEKGESKERKKKPRQQGEGDPSINYMWGNRILEERMKKKHQCTGK